MPKQIPLHYTQQAIASIMQQIAIYEEHIHVLKTELQLEQARLVKYKAHNLLHKAESEPTPEHDYVAGQQMHEQILIQKEAR